MVRMVSPDEEKIDTLEERFRSFVRDFLKKENVVETDWLDHDEVAFHLTHVFTDLMWELLDEEKLEADADSS